MFFTRSFSYQSSLTRDDLKRRLIGKHVKIHNLDFEVLEDEDMLSIIPHAEQVESIKTLPITFVRFNEQDGKTKVLVRSEMRKLDMGGPMLVLIACIILFLVSGVLHYVAQEPMLTYVLGGTGLLILVAFLIRMQTGYFDYIRKVRSYIKSKEGLN